MLPSTSSKTRRSALLLVVGLAAAVPAGAETRPEHPYRVRTGQRVRMWSAPDFGGFEATDGVVTASDATGLTVVIKDRTELVTFDTLARLDVRRGWRYMRRGALVGLVVGAALGALVDDGDTEDVLESAALYGAAGAGAGALTAGAMWPARWLPVDLDQIRAAPPAARAPGGGMLSSRHAGGGARLSFTVSF